MSHRGTPPRPAPGRPAPGRKVALNPPTPPPWFARDLARDPEGHIWYFVVILITLAILAVKTWGLVALALPAVFLTPVMFVILVLISVGK